MNTKDIGSKTGKSTPKPIFHDRPVPPPANRGPAAEPMSQAELAEWVRKAKDLPDIRWDKVKAMREALAGSQFDIEERLARLGDKLPSEVLAMFQQLGEGTEERDPQ